MQFRVKILVVKSLPSTRNFGVPDQIVLKNVLVYNPKSYRFLVLIQVFTVHYAQGPTLGQNAQFGPMDDFAHF